MELYNDGMAIIKEIISYRINVGCGQLNLNLPSENDDIFVKIVVLYNIFHMLLTIISIPIFSNNPTQNKDRYLYVTNLKNKIIIWLKSAYNIVSVPSKLSKLELLFNYSKYGYSEFLMSIKELDENLIIKHKDELIQKYIKITGGKSNKIANTNSETKFIYNHIIDFTNNSKNLIKSDILIRRYLNNSPQEPIVYNVNKLLADNNVDNILPVLNDDILNKYKTINLDISRNYERVIETKEVKINKLDVINAEFIELYNNTLSDKILKNIKICTDSDYIHQINLGSNLFEFINFQSLAYLKSKEEIRDTIKTLSIGYLNSALYSLNPTIKNYLELNLCNSIYINYPIKKIIDIINEDFVNSNIKFPGETPEDIIQIVNLLSATFKKGIDITILARPAYSIEQYLCYN